MGTAVGLQIFNIGLSPVPQALQDPESTKDGLKQSVPIPVQLVLL